MTPTGSLGRIETLNGVPIYFEVHGDGDPVLLLHGFSGCSQDWTAVLGSSGIVTCFREACTWRTLGGVSENGGGIFARRRKSLTQRILRTQRTQSGEED